MNVIEIGPLVIEIGGVENSGLVFPVNNTCASHSFLGHSYMTVCLDTVWLLNYQNYDLKNIFI